MTEEWIIEKEECGNRILRKVDKETGEKFSISYQDFEFLKKQAREFKFTLSREELMQHETAIIIGKRIVGILCGDFREKFEPCETLEECMEVYKDNEDNQCY